MVALEAVDKITPFQIQEHTLQMVFQHIENLQQEYTDKYVVVDQEQPELLRFNGMTGIVRTVNMNGRALVEFDGYNNIGWYDIDIDFLRVIDEPLPEAAKEKKPEATQKEDKEDKAPSELKKAREKDSGEMSVDEILAAAKGESANSAAPETGTSDAAAMSVDDILAAARTGSDGGSEAASDDEPAKEKAEKPADTVVKAVDASDMSVDDILAAARTGSDGGSETASDDEPAKEKAEKPADTAVKAVDASDMSVDDILAAARTGSDGGSEAASDDEPADEDSPVAVEQEAAEEEVVVEAEEPTAPAGELPTDIDEIIAYCQRVDGK